MKRNYHPLAYDKAHPVKDVASREAWAAEHEVCACCDWTPWQRKRLSFDDCKFALQVHHIIKQGRSDDECNLLRLCNRCHDLAEYMHIRQESGVLFPKLTLGMCLWLKKESDPEHWNPERLEQLYHKRLPDLEPVPEVFIRERERR